MGTDVEVAVVMGHHGYYRMGIVTARRFADEGRLIYDNQCVGTGYTIVYYREV